MSTNVMEALAAEIRYCATLRERLRVMGDEAGAAMPSIVAALFEGNAVVLLSVIDAALDRAVKAAGSGEALDCIAALQELRRFTPGAETDR